MSKIGPKEAQRRALREFKNRPAGKLIGVDEGQDYMVLSPRDMVQIKRGVRDRRKRPVGRVKPVRSGVEAKPASDVPQRRAKAVLCAPLGVCVYCDRRRTLSCLLMRRLRASRIIERKQND